MSVPLYPLLLKPALHPRVWGGRQLATLFHKPLPTDEPYGESWELHDTAQVANGALAGQSIAALLHSYGEALTGQPVNPAEGLPLLIKFLDANDWLSVQVHPDDEQARKLDGDPRGKTEAWIVLAAAPGARLVIGVQAGLTREAMAEAIRSNTLQDQLVYAEVQAGDVLFIAANTIHAIGPGLLIYEVQQSCDLTYRLYDWGRMGLDGKPRALHIEKGVAVSNIASVPPITHPQGDGAVLVECPYFRTVQHILKDETRHFACAGRYHALSCIAGEINIAHPNGDATLALGQTALLPASLGAVTLSGTGTLLQSHG